MWNRLLKPFIIQKGKNEVILSVNVLMINMINMLYVSHQLILSIYACMLSFTKNTSFISVLFNWKINYHNWILLYWSDSVDILYIKSSTCICNFMSFTSQSKFSFVIHVIQWWQIESY